MTEKFTSEDLLLLAHDEWKRREERKHIHDHKSWVAGFMGGFCTSKEWARERLDKIKESGKPRTTHHPVAPADTTRRD